jgi:uncharacterized SAM-binding protein YcdF (DUF218 family)
MLNDIATALVSPLGLVLGLLALAFALARFRRTARALLALAMLALWVMSTPLAARAAASLLERQYPPVPVASLPASDVIIVLGGVTGSPWPPRQDVELRAGADRLLLAADLMRAGKAPRLLLTGGLVEPGQTLSEAEQMRSVLVRFGVDPAAIVLEPRAGDTAQNALFSAELMAAKAWRTAILVTSGTHMPRAVAAFARAGVAVTPAPTDIVAVTAPPGLADYLPDARAFAEASGVIKEAVGYVYYMLRGWI